MFWCYRPPPPPSPPFEIVAQVNVRDLQKHHVDSFTFTDENIYLKRYYDNNNTHTHERTTHTCKDIRTHANTYAHATVYTHI